MSTISDMFDEIVKTDCLRDQTIMDLNLSANEIPVERDHRPEHFGRIEQKIPLDDDARWLAIQTTPRTWHDR